MHHRVKRGPAASPCPCRAIFHGATLHRERAPLHIETAPAVCARARHKGCVDIKLHSRIGACKNAPSLGSASGDSTPVSGRVSAPQRRACD
eukprot:2595237-Prymnesium_polylepis.3